MSLSDTYGTAQDEVLAIENGCMCMKTPATRRLRVAVNVLQCFGFYPKHFRLESNHSSWTRSAADFMVSKLPFLFCTTNMALLFYNVRTIHMYRTEYGMMHAFTVVSIISGVLPLQNAFALAIFWKGLRTHNDVLQKMDNIHLFTYPAGSNGRFYLKCFLCWLIPFIAIVIEMCLVPALIAEWSGAMALILVPVLRAWQIVPLAYWQLFCDIHESWFAQLYSQIDHDTLLLKNTLSTYFQYFLKLTDIVEELGSFINPFIFSSLLFSVATLCLTIYFVTQADRIDEVVMRINESFFMGTGGNQTESDLFVEKLMTYYDVGWACLQVLIAIYYIIAICDAGRRINEAVSQFYVTCAIFIIFSTIYILIDKYLGKLIPVRCVLERLD